MIRYITIILVTLIGLGLYAHVNAAEAPTEQQARLAGAIAELERQRNTAQADLANAAGEIAWLRQRLAEALKPKPEADKK